MTTPERAERQAGFYWVTFADGTQEPAQYFPAIGHPYTPEPAYWEIIGVELYKDTYTDSDFKSIGPRIPSPEEPNQLLSELRRTENRLAAQDERVKALEVEVETGLQIAGSFFDALKPLKLAGINVSNPGQHVTDVIDQLAAAQELIRDAYNRVECDASDEYCAEFKVRAEKAGVTLP